MMMTSAAMMAHPPSQPAQGPNARADQMNVVPQSGSPWLSSRNATAMRYIGTKAISRMAGVFSPASTTIRPRLAARL